MTLAPSGWDSICVVRCVYKGQKRRIQITEMPRSAPKHMTLAQFASFLNRHSGIEHSDAIEYVHKQIDKALLAQSMQEDGEHGQGQRDGEGRLHAEDDALRSASADANAAEGEEEVE